MIILGIDTSCDDTSVAVVGDGKILSNIVSSQVSLHNCFGGVVPEIASRKHVEQIEAIYEEALAKAGLTIEDIEIVAVTNGPGLIGSVLIGLCFAKGLGLATGKPLIGVNHVEAHAMGMLLEEEVEFPLLALVVSGGHSVILHFSEPCQFKMVGSTRDDAAGEAFDKIAKYLGLGYPGGMVIERMAEKGDRGYVAFPRPMVDEKNYDFSFSGLKTSFITYTKKHSVTEENLHHLLASFQYAACDVLSYKTLKAAVDLNVKRVVIGGGVACNSTLRTLFRERGASAGVSIHIPSPGFCTDNAAMIAATATLYAKRGRFSNMDMKAFSRMKWS
jgi:N6-L-threonylcarbamoyladenine synthase